MWGLINSLDPGDAFMILADIGAVNSLLPDDTYALPGPMLTHHQ